DKVDIDWNNIGTGTIIVKGLNSFDDSWLVSLDKFNSCVIRRGTSASLIIVFNSSYLKKLSTSIKIGEYEVTETSDGIKIGCYQISDNTIKEIAQLRKII
ncbi:MAG: hypothetical protein AABY22_11390, partial [Nanoarchaeota archaeon]